MNIPKKTGPLRSTHSEGKVRWCWLASSLLSFLERHGASRGLQADHAIWRFLLDGFMTRWSFVAFGSGTYASKYCWLWRPLSPTPTLPSTCNSDVLTLNEAAALLRVHPVTLRKRAVAWGVPHRRLGAEWRFSSEVLTAWIKRREEDAA
jgi:hypothetical protein